MSDLVVREQGAVAIQAPGPAEWMHVIRQAAADPNVDVNKMKALLDLAERMEDKAAEREFKEALARVQERMPKITKDGQLVNHKTGTLQSRYARLESIHRVLKPLLAEEGFSLTFMTRMEDSRLIVTGTLNHRAGHSHVAEVPLSLDTQGNKNATQATGSTITYGQRYLIKMMFNIAEEGEDTDGAPPPEFITQAQANQIDDFLAEHKLPAKLLLEWLKVTSYQDIPANRFNEVMAALRRKVAK